MSKIAIIRNGCSSETTLKEYFVSNFSENNHTLAKSLTDAEYLVFQSCAGTGVGIDNITKELDCLMHYKPSELKVILVGCFNRIPGYVEQIKQLYPDLIVVPDSNWITPVFNHINNTNNLTTEEQLLQSHTISLPLRLNNSQTSIGFFIAKGCNNKCTFCKGHYLDNRIKSLPYDKVLEYLTAKVNSGTRIISLHSDNSTQYGIDLYDKPVLHNLINELSKLENLVEISLGEITVKDMYPELLSEIQQNHKISQVGMQLESASDIVLKAMDRGHTINQYTDVLNEIRKNRKVAFKTILMSAFPTGTIDHLEETVEYVTENDIYVDGICRYDDSLYIPSHNLKQLSKKESLYQTRYLVEKIRIQRKAYLLNHLADIKKAMVISHQDGATIFSTFSPICGVSYKNEYANLPLGTIFEPESVKLIKKAKLFKEYGYRI